MKIQGVQISRILHAGYVFKAGATEILFDPIFENPFSQNCFAFPAVEFDYQKIQKAQFAAVFISHFHDDHCSLESLKYIHRGTPIYLHCEFQELFEWIRALGFERVIALEIDHKVQIETISVTPIKALDEKVDCLFHIRVADLHILNVVDSWLTDEVINSLAQIKWDLVLWPFQLMREMEVLSPSRAQPFDGSLPPEWVIQLQKLQPRFLVPSSCQFQFEQNSWLNLKFFPISYAFFANEMKSILPNTVVLRMDPSRSWFLDLNGRLNEVDSLAWVRPMGPQNLDYIYDEQAVVVSVAEFSKQFPALSVEQKKRVITFCRKELLQKYKDLGPFVDPYFDRLCFWKLSLYDHRGEKEDYIFRIQGSSIQRVREAQNQLGWLTELSEWKLYSVLVFGESLSSLGVRINDQKFSPQTEDRLLQVDLIEDPLLRCLYSAEFGTYQKAQLRRLVPRFFSTEK